jgi:GH15 family glucan-1,4-alpha-glucosidase
MPRIHGYAPIRDYAAIGDGRTVALVARDGAIDWLCLPNLDSPSVCAAMLDAERGGAFVVQPGIPFEATRRYLPGTNVLETTFTTDAGCVQLLDLMTLPDGGLSPSREIARAVIGVAGRVPMRWRFAPRFNYGAGRPEYGWRDHVPVATWGSDAVALCSWDAGTPTWEGGEVGAAFDVREGGRALVTLAAAYGEPLVFPGRRSIEKRVQHTLAFWERWSAARRYQGGWRDAVIRSALVLKLLIFAPTGASAAAATMSLPEEVGGERNWDYRFCWIRDSALATNALLQLGCRAEAQALFWWYLQAAALTAPRLQVLYRLDGGPHAPERSLDLAGYRGSRPVRVGNAALHQTQLDIYGNLIQTAWQYGRGERLVDFDIGAFVGGIADYVCSVWRGPDSGIWEVRGPCQHFTHSKVMCWVALDRALRLAEEGGVPGRHASHWRREAAAIESFVNASCWSDNLSSYTRAAGRDDLDASLLTLPLFGFGDPGGHRVAGTVDAVARHLRRGPYVDRYRADDGLPGREGSFLACSFWLADALARGGRVDEAIALMNELVALANDVGLYAEEIDPTSGDFLGNFPQALVHLSLVDAAFAIAAAVGEAHHEVEPGTHRENR